VVNIVQTQFGLNDTVIIEVSHEEGTVVGRSEFCYCEPQYLVRYKDKDGKGVEQWWTQSALTQGVVP
jgi:hypothetical protein